MLKLAQKRSLWESDVPPAAGPFSPTTRFGAPPSDITSGDEISSPIKRLKHHRRDAGQSTQEPRPSPFALPSTQEMEDVNNLLPKRRSNKSINETEKLYTEAEVNEIVTRALQKREYELQLKYDAILQRLLQEQYNSFAKFNEDYISRQIKPTDLSYLS
jgi:hypothetical protein